MVQVSAPKSPIARPRNCTFEAADWDILARHWYPVAVAADVGPDRPQAASLLDVDLVLYRIGQRVVVALDRCPHRGVMLSRGWIAGDCLICPYHGLHFDADGRCTAIPSQPGARIPNRLSLTAVASVERYGLIWASLRSDTPSLPRFDAWDDADYQSIMCPTIDIAGSAGRQVEGFIDVAHFAWAHTTTFGDRTNPVVPDYSVEDTPDGCRVEYLSNVSNYAPDQRHRAPADFVWRRAFEVYPPFAASLVVDFPDGRHLWILNAASPVSARKTRLFCPLARNFDQSGSIEAVREFNLKVFNEDRVLIEAQRPEDLPLDLSLEVHIAADKTSVAYRRLLKRMGLGLNYTI
jgi:phenylpropionate dioxygenase-like ring-hydroxylating dioxygenase large terminal subunit